MEQRSDEWFAARCGKITGSRFAAVMALTVKDSKPKEQRLNLINTLVLERLTGLPEEIPDNAPMAWGREQEAAARGWYEFTMDCEVEQHGFVLHDTLPNVGVSPDGSVRGPEPLRLVEIKCPYSRRVYLDVLRTREVDPDYYWQVQGQMMVMNAAGLDLVYFHPHMPPGLQGFVIDVPRSDAAILRLIDECSAVDAQVDKIVNELREQMKEKA